MAIALEFLLSSIITKDTEKLLQFTKEPVDDFIEHVKNVKECALNKGVKEKVVDLLHDISFFTTNLNGSIKYQELENFYDELDLKGNESLFHSALKMTKFRRRITNDYPTKHRKSKSTVEKIILTGEVKYDSIENLFCK